MPEVEDRVVGVDRGQHVAEGAVRGPLCAVVGVVVVCVPRGVQVHGHLGGEVLGHQHEQCMQCPVQGHDRGNAGGQYHDRIAVVCRLKSK